MSSQTLFCISEMNKSSIEKISFSNGVDKSIVERFIECLSISSNMKLFSENYIVKVRVIKAVYF